MPLLLNLRDPDQRSRAKESARHITADFYRTNVDRGSTFGIADALFPTLTIIAIGVGIIIANRKREETVLRKWAQAGGFEIIAFERAYFAGGFSWLTTSRGQRVFSVTVRDREAREHSGWVRCGSYVGGVWFSDAAEVKWKKD